MRSGEGDLAPLDRSLAEIDATVSQVDTLGAGEVGLRWARCRQAGGPRERIIADFLIGAHAVIKADKLLTMDRGFCATCFPELRQP